MCQRPSIDRTPSGDALADAFKKGKANAAIGDRPGTAFDGGRDTAGARPAATPVPLVPTRRPATPPPFKLSDLRAAIPPHCFHRSAARSLAYVALDLALLALAALAASRIGPTFPASPLARGVAWALYWSVAGCVGTGAWVCAHECGHGAFSTSPTLNDAVGAALHTLLLVPYWSWKFSHARHHAHTGDVEGDEVFVPPVSWDAGTAGRASLAGTATGRALRSAPGRLAAIGAALTLGWPLYLTLNVSGRSNYDHGREGREDPSPSFLPPNHFDPGSPIFSKRQRAGVAGSAALVGGMLAALAGAVQKHGAATVFCFYGAPLLVTNAFLVVITLLQHSHPALPHYAASADWDWLRGALATVDRSFGPLLDAAFHHIADTHVLHHLFSGIPHYHAQEAAAAIKPVLGDWYAADGRSVLRALWEDWRDCHWVSPDRPGESALWFRGDRD